MAISILAAPAEQTLLPLAEVTDRGRALVEAATADLVAADFALGSLSAEQLGELSTLLRPVREAAGDF